MRSVTFICWCLYILMKIILEHWGRTDDWSTFAWRVDVTACVFVFLLNSVTPCDACLYQWIGSSLVQVNVMMMSSNGNIFRATGPLCGNSPVPVNSLDTGQWRGALMFSLICVWINGWVNNREAGDLRRHRGHYDVNVMFSPRNYMHQCLPIVIWTLWNKLE